MQYRPLGRTNLRISPLVFGANVFGWTVDDKTAFQLLDRLQEAGINAIDTADSYAKWANPGSQGGESETTIGKWLAQEPGRREKMVLITKVGSELTPDKKGLSADYIPRAIEASLKRLQTDYVDLYLSHWPDPDTPYEETLRAYEKLIAQGKARAIGASNLDAAQLQASLEVARTHDLPRYDVLQPQYNLFSRDTYDGALRDLCMQEDLGVITYYSLASGFLTGKYRSQDDLDKSKRGGGIAKYLTPRGFRILDALDQVGAAHDAQPAEIALAWLMARPGVSAPIASATSVKQLNSLIRAAQVTLTADDLARLDAASLPDADQNTDPTAG